MRIVSLVMFIVSFCITSDIYAQSYKSSAGVRIGTSFAGSYKVFLSEQGALEAIAGISREGGQSLFAFGAFYQIHNPITSDVPNLNWYYGGGVFVSLGNDDVNSTYSITGNIGIEYMLDAAPITLFVDGIPYLTLNNGNRFDTEASLGVRYIFN